MSPKAIFDLTRVHGDTWRVSRSLEYAEPAACWPACKQKGDSIPLVPVALPSLCGASALNAGDGRVPAADLSDGRHHPRRPAGICSPHREQSVNADRRWSLFGGPRPRVITPAWWRW
ncbi:hypothetical protein WOLCODRAFT_151918 [Wolfiporia cocos MD-104 SS10]|uniref:Uncharacterized protein n=1 Tax=Wolfiporia cocos (strain MD-104) TaxID=742152 RepID=A0A2H3JSS3_WOLCO|nr:hypothetical protein WOLCODRAFT_151918 [Wolfiporia cocos MD-104 SS10]